MATGVFVFKIVFKWNRVNPIVENMCVAWFVGDTSTCLDWTQSRPVNVCLKKTQPAATLIRGVIVQPLGGLPLNSMIFHVTSARINQNPLQLFFQSDWWGWTSSHHTIRTCEHFAGNVSEKWWQHMVGVRRFLLFWWAWLDDSWQQKIIPRAPKQ